MKLNLKISLVISLAFLLNINEIFGATPSTKTETIQDDNGWDLDGEGDWDGTELAYEGDNEQADKDDKKTEPETALTLKVSDSIVPEVKTSSTSSKDRSLFEAINCADIFLLR